VLLLLARIYLLNVLYKLRWILTNRVLLSATAAGHALIISSYRVLFEMCCKRPSLFLKTFEDRGIRKTLFHIRNLICVLVGGQ